MVQLTPIACTYSSTGKPKGVLHTTGGYMVQAATTFRYVFNVRPEARDLFLCTADCGWITGAWLVTSILGERFGGGGCVVFNVLYIRTGHSYVTYGPLLNAASQVVFEGVPSYPDGKRQ